jgi:hypothetical protein
MGQSATAGQYTYRRRQPEETVLYKTLAANVETFIADREVAYTSIERAGRVPGVAV